MPTVEKKIPMVDFDALITAINSLAAPSATNVAVDATGMDIITAENAQGALKQLDTAVDSINSNLAKLTIDLGSSITGSTDTEYFQNVIRNLMSQGSSCLFVGTRTGAYYYSGYFNYVSSTRGVAIVTRLATDSYFKPVSILYNGSNDIRVNIPS